MTNRTKGIDVPFFGGRWEPPSGNTDDERRAAVLAVLRRAGDDAEGARVALAMLGLIEGDG